MNKEYHFDVEIIIDHNIKICGVEEKIATHHRMRGLKLAELNRLIKNNMVPEDASIDITFNIRGVNY